jgi:RNA polymerase sigma-70 factor (ECF subfamily)
MLNFHDIYVEHASHVRRFALFLTGDESRADDLTSETFLRAWAAADRLQAATLRSYLLTIARNLHRDGLRRSRHEEPLDAEIIAPESRAEAALDARDELSRVLRVAATLPAIDRTVLFEHALGGRSYREIATSHGISVAAAKIKVYRARIKLMMARSITNPTQPERRSS